MCVGPVKDMMSPKGIQNPASAAPSATPPPPIPIGSPSMSEAKSTEQSAPDMAIKKRPKSGTSLRIDKAASSGSSSGVNLPY